MNESLSIAEILDRILNFPLIRLERGPLTLVTLLELAVLVAAVFVFEIIVRRVILRRILERTRLQPSVRFALTRIAGYIILTLGIYQSLTLVGIDLSSLAIVAGAIGVGLGFGLQNVISNFISGFIILIERPISIGDRVEVGETTGKVQRIGLRSTSVVTNDNITIIVPNSAFITERVTNWSHDDARVRVRIPFGVAYGSDVNRLKASMVEMAKDHPGVLSDPPPDLLFTGFGESSLDFELGVWSTDYNDRPLGFRSGLLYAIEARLREIGIEVPFPQRDLHLRSGSLVLRPGDGAPSTEAIVRRRVDGGGD